MKSTNLGALVGDGVNEGVAVKKGNGVAVATVGAGTITIPTAPISTNANPLIELIIKSLGYFICINEP
jgi:hypothetical protein